MGRPIDKVTIVGGGTAGWLAATLLQAYGRKKAPGSKPLKISVIESPDIPTVGVGEATVPAMVRTLQSAGVSEREFFKTCNASFKLGVVFDHWNVDKAGKRVTYINPFSAAPTINGIDMAHYYQRFGAGPLDYVQAYSPAVDLWRARKGPRAAGSKEFDYPIGFAYHLDAGKFAGMLTEHCVKNGVNHIRENVLEVEQDESGAISALKLDKTGRHKVELVIDCTGFRGLIINKALQEPFLSYSKYLANDKAMAVQIPHPDPDVIEPVTRSTALGAGWSWRVPLYNRIGTGYVFSSAHRTDDEAREEFLAHLGPAAKDAEPRIIPMRVGRNRNAWVKNCVAIGLSGGFIEPLESTAIYMIDMGIRWLITYFPDKEFPDPLRQRYNHLVDQLYDEVRDFVCLHYRLGNRTDSQYWLDARTELEVSDRLAENIELWRHNLPFHYDLPFTTLFDAGTYTAVLLGKKVYETGFANGKIGSGLSLDPQLWKTALEQMRQRTKKFLRGASDHHDLLAELRGEERALGFKAAFPVTQATVPLPGVAPAFKAPRPRPAASNGEPNML